MSFKLVQMDVNSIPVHPEHAKNELENIFKAKANKSYTAIPFDRTEAKDLEEKGVRAFLFDHGFIIEINRKSNMLIVRISEEMRKSLNE